MQWIFRFLFTQRTLTSFVLLTLISIWMIQLPTEGQGKVARFLLISVFYPFHATLNEATRIKDIYAENKQLKAQVTGLRLNVAQLKDQAAENKRLQGLLGLQSQYEYTLIPARVAARDGSLFFRSVVINVGSQHGCRQYMPVVNQSGVVGKIVQVLPQVSLVQLVQDPSNRLSVMTQRGRSIGILETDDGNTFFILFRLHLDIRVGDELVTSGLGGIYPKGMPVGKVMRFKNEGDPLFSKAYIKTSADFEHLEEVFVMNLSPQWSAFRSELDSLDFNAW